MCHRHGRNYTPILLFYTTTHHIINLYIIAYEVDVLLVSMISKSVNLLSLQQNVLATVDRGGIMANMSLDELW